MNHSESNPTSRAAVLAIGVVLAAMSAFYAYTSVEPSAATQSKPMTGIDGPPRDDGRSSDDGHLQGSVTVFDESASAVANLDPKFLKALRSAATDAADQGIQLQVTSGWRSADYQAQLLRDAISKYGSEREAARWVATPDTSPHVSGDAVDIGKSDAVTWLSRHGAAYGLCQIYRNEPWHYELRPKAVDQGCPGMYADPTHDPRMQ
jgi:D-alanyl-D-alanine carboxypeptidase